MLDWLQSDDLPEDFGQLFAVCRAVLEKQLARLPAGGDPPPFGIVRHGDCFKLLGLRMADEDEKNGAAMFLAAFAQELQADEVAFASSAWMSTRPGQRPSMDACRVEVVMVLLESRQVYAQVLFPVVRGEKVSVGEPKISVFSAADHEVTLSGRFVGLLDREVEPAVTEAVRNMLRDSEPKGCAQPGLRFH